MGHTRVHCGTCARVWVSIWICKLSPGRSRESQNGAGSEVSWAVSVYACRHHTSTRSVPLSLALSLSFSQPFPICLGALLVISWYPLSGLSCCCLFSRLAGSRSAAAVACLFALCLTRAYRKSTETVAREQQKPSCFLEMVRVQKNAEAAIRGTKRRKPGRETEGEV